MVCTVLLGTEDAEAGRLSLSRQPRASERGLLEDSVCAQPQRNAQQNTSEQTWIGECARALEDCKAIVSTLEDYQLSSSAIEDEVRPKGGQADQAMM